MNGNDFLNNMELIDDDLICDADKMPLKQAKPVFKPWLAAAACAAVLAVFVGLFAGRQNHQEPSEDILFSPTTVQPQPTEPIVTFPAPTQGDVGDVLKPSEDAPTMPVLPTGISYLTVDVNPSLRLTVENGLVVELFALNDDGEQILTELSLVGLPVKDAMVQIISELIAQGYLASEGHAPVMLLSAQGGDGSQALLHDAVNAAWDTLTEKQVETFIVTQQVADDATVTMLAEQYGVSVGKMQYVLNLLQEETDISLEEASACTILELFSMDIEKRLIEPPYKVGDYDEYGEKVLFVGSVESYVGYVPWEELSEEYKNELASMYTPEALAILAMPRVWTTMPNVVGLSADEALQLLYSRNLAPMICYEDSAEARANGFTDGTCFAQAVPQGWRWNSDACVHIWILISDEKTPEV